MSIGELRRVLRDAGIFRDAGGEPAPKELADILWLAAILKQDRAASDPLSLLPAAKDDSLLAEPETPQDRMQDPEEKAAPPSEVLPPDGAQPRHPIPKPISPLHLTLPSSALRTAMAAGNVIQVTTTPQLPDPLRLAGAMRPLRRRVITSGPGTLDEEATADLRAEQRLWLPALVPTTDPAFDLAIVIDDSESMALWSAKIREFRLLCEQLGGLRDVRTWHLSTGRDGHPGQPALHAAASGSQARDPRELADPSGRRIILVITDGVHPWWAPSGPLRPILARWALFGPVAIIQPFPQRLWSRSILRPIAGQFWSGWAGNGPTIAAADSLAVPVLELTPRVIGRWASLIAGGLGAVPFAAAILPRDPGDAAETEPQREGVPDPDSPPQGAASPQPAQPDPEQIVRSFRAAVSPAAYRLAGYLSAAQLTLPIMRMIQESNMPGTGPSELAEVLLSGLLRRSPETGPTADPDRVQYVFRAGVREILQSMLTHAEALNVLDQVGEYLLRKRPSGRSFSAALARGPDGDEVAGETVILVAAREFPESFGRISGMLLQRLGDAARHAPLAQPLGAIVNPPHVFVSYARDDAAHVEQVQDFSLFLRANGIDVRLDLPTAKRQDWAHWITREIQEADRILVVASPPYRRLGENDAAPGEGRAVLYEARLIEDRFNADQDAGLKQVLPVVLPGSSPDDLPLWLFPTMATHFTVTDYTMAGAEQLLRALTGQPQQTEPGLGAVPSLPSREIDTVVGMTQTADLRLAATRAGTAGELRTGGTARGALLSGTILINFGEGVDGALVNAIALVGRRISVAAAGLRGRHGAEDVSVARWFGTYSLTGTPPDLPGLSEDLAQRLAVVLGGDEFQAALQELLAARLTDAPETDASAARQVLTLTLISAAADAAPVADALAGYYDDQICDLVARLEADDPPLLAQIRSDAFSTRMINVLSAIERHTAALTTRPTQRTEATFLSGYRRHVTILHGELEPPDFDRRRRVPIEDIYVPTIITEEPPPGRTAVARPGARSAFDVYELAGKLDRTVLLGDPGGGNTTTANVLMHHFASYPEGRVPFLVTLRDYASVDPPQRSVVGHIEHLLTTFYQIPSPAGLVDLLLLTGRAVVIFDGLDQLLDTARRADVTNRVEHFCAEYPLTPVLVTSRIVGYDQARLDDREFTCYRLGGFGDSEVTKYAQKWFRQAFDARPDDADTFLAESESVRDLRSNPLLLSLMCILYRGEGSLPRNRAEVYEQCADLLFRRWDARRRIHQELRAGHLVEPALRDLAWRLFALELPQPTITERALIDAAARFLQARGFESEDDAQAAAVEFVEFCRGRMWVFTDVGSTATGERLYAFTHRAFLEYFAAAQIAFSKESPEQLASALIPHIAHSESWVVAELAVQIKDRTSDRGASRIYAALLRERHGPSPATLQFLALCLRSADPSPQQVRELTRQLFTVTCDAGSDVSSDSSLRSAWRELISHRGAYHDMIADEIDAAVARAVGSGREDLIVSSLRLSLSLRDALSPGRGDYPDREAWTTRAYSHLTAHGPAAIAAARADAYIRHGAVRAGLISVRKALDMPGGPTVLFRPSHGVFGECAAYFGPVLSALAQGWPAFGQLALVADLDAFGAYLIDHREPPWLGVTYFEVATLLVDSETQPGALDRRPPPLSQAAYLGAAVLLLIMEETRLITTQTGRQLGPLRHLAPYLSRRRGLGRRTELPSLMVPEGFKQAFRDWAEGRIDATSH